MAQNEYHFDGYADGTGFLANGSNTGATQVTTNGGTATFEADYAATGQCGAKFVPVSGQQCLARFAFPSSDRAIAFHGVVTTPPTAPTTTSPTWLMTIRASGAIFKLAYYDTRKLVLIDTTSGIPFGYVQASGGGDLVLANDTKYRIEIQMTVDAVTAGAGAIDFQIYSFSPGAAGTKLNNDAHASSHITAANLGTAAVTAADVGVLSQNTYIATTGWDELILQSGSASVIGVYTQPVVDLLPSTATATAAGWTKTGAGIIAAVLSDEDDATYMRSPDTPTGAEIQCLMNGFVKPTPGSDFVVRVRCRANTAVTSSVVLKIYSPDNVTLLATSQTGTVTSSITDVDCHFLAADISAITDAQWSSGLSFRLQATAT